jgi:polyhydroxyalkanoate synthesis regulator phasin|tara:strand:- start:12 stop:296 length:285 start_codon:yes stop_codon:yes gene_type:complete
MSVDYYKLTKDFLVNEGQISDTNILTYVQALSETIANMRPRSQAEGRRLAMAKQQLKEIKKFAKRLHEQISVLEERVNVLEEIKEDIEHGKTNS